jgi:hypothetical protein
MASIPGGEIQWRCRWSRQRIHRGFRAEPKEQSLSTLESIVVRQLLSTGGQSGSDPEEIGRHEDTRRSNGFGSDRADGGEVGLGTDIGASVR